MPNVKKKKRRRRYSARTPVWKIVVADFLLAALIVGGWWVCRKASVYVEAARFNKAAEKTEASVSAVQTPKPESTAAPEENTQVQNEPENVDPCLQTPEETPQEPDDRTEWQKKFEDFFTDEIIQTENSYSSPDISVQITQGTLGEGKDLSVYYVADIHISKIECLRSYFAHGLSYPSRTDLMPRMYDEAGALLAINGDYCGLNFGGIVLRNGESIKTQANGSDICILFYDGTMECMKSNDYREEDFPDRKPYQIWCFGPYMMDGAGNVLDESRMNLASYLSGFNPRTGMGYFEPGHYCFVVADGRTDGYSKGMYMNEFASIFEKLGCIQAFNLDGGGSSSMMFNGDFYNRPSSGGERDMPDIILIREPDELSSEEQN